MRLSIFIADFEQVSAGWEAKGGGEKASEINKNFFSYFYWSYVCFFASFACWRFQTGKILFRKKQ